MAKKIILYVLGFVLLLNSYGCVLLLAGAAGGAGTALWLSDKLAQDVNASFDKSVQAAKTAFKKLDMSITKETTTGDVAQLLSEYAGKKVWVDIHRVTENASRIEVRVGIKGDEVAARKILDKILKYL